MNNKIDFRKLKNAGFDFLASIDFRNRSRNERRGPSGLEPRYACNFENLKCEGKSVKDKRIRVDE